MSMIFQPGQHPDADQLSAFAEQALPAHEREATLAHLAVCAECRDFVALSLPAADQLPASAQKLARRPWFSGWVLAIPTAMAVAALTLAVIYVHRTAGTKHTAAARTQMAATSLPAPAAPTRQQANSLSAAAPRKYQSQPAARSQSASLSAAAKRPNAASVGQAAASPPIVLGKDRMAVEQQPPALPASAPSETRERAAGAASTGLGSGAALGMSAGSAVHPPPPGPPPVQEDQLRNLTSTAAPSMSNALAPPAPGAGSGQLHGASTAPVRSASANRPLDAPTSAKPLPNLHSLPSGLPVLSIAVHGRQILALDGAHALFLSDDTGVHWTAIAAPWKSSAVKVRLISYGGNTAVRTQSAPRRSIVAEAHSPLPPAPTNASLGGTIQDPSGADVPHASVVIRNLATHSSLTVKTDPHGRYSANGLAPGAYDIEVQSPGFQTGRATGVKVIAAQQTERNFTLAIGAAAQTVEVQAEPPVNVEREAGPPAAQIPPSPRPEPPAAHSPAPIFEIVTEDGARWISADGLTWNRQ